MKVGGARGLRARCALARRISAALPAPAAERGRLLLARWMARRQRRSPAVRGAALVFHAVAARAGDPATEIDPALARDRLYALVGYLKRHYVLVRAAELPVAARARPSGAPLPIALTFDDDLVSHLEQTAPVLLEHHAVATAFLTGSPAPFWWQLLQAAVDARAISADGLAPICAELVEPALERERGAIGRLARAIEELAPAERDRVREALRKAVDWREPTLGASGAAALRALGWEIGFHTRRHDVLPALDPEAVRAALRRAPHELTGEVPVTLAYPHGKATDREARIAGEAGYLAAYTGRAEVFTDRTDIHLIGRLQPDTSSVGRFALELARSLSDS